MVTGLLGACNFDTFQLRPAKIYLAHSVHQILGQTSKMSNEM